MFTITPSQLKDMAEAIKVAIETKIRKLIAGPDLLESNASSANKTTLSSNVDKTNESQSETTSPSAPATDNKSPVSPLPPAKNVTVHSCVLQDNIPSPYEGLLTWNQEGNEGKLYFSRKPHVPDPKSGVTLGRGYDMKNREKSEIQGDLEKVGIPKETAILFSEGAKKFGAEAEKFIEVNNLSGYCITPEQQLSLFNISFKKEEGLMINLYNIWKTKHSTLPNWNDLSQKTRDLLVDMKYRGDVTEKTDLPLVNAIKSAEPKELQDLIMNKDMWSNVPKERFNSRIQYTRQIDQI